MIKAASFRALLTILALVAIVPAALLLVYTLYGNTQQRVVEAKFSARMLAGIIAADVGHTLAAKQNMLRRLSSRPAVRAMNADDCDRILWDMREIFPEFANATTVDMQGMAICSAVAQPGGQQVNVSKANWFRRTLAEESFVVSNPFFGPITGRWVSVLTYPIRNEQKKMIGMLGFPIDLALFVPPISTVPLMSGTMVSIISAEGTIVWHSIDAEKWVGRNVGDQASIRNMMTIHHGDLEATGIDGVDRFYSVTPVVGADWYVQVGIPKDAVFAEVRAGLLRNALLGLAALLCLAGVVLHMARRIEHPVAALLLTVQNVKRGNREVKAETGGPAEISEVAEEFNEMLDVRRQAEQRLEDMLTRQTRTEAKLAQTNNDLQRFAEVTAHHLQEPARRIASYAERLTKQLGERLEDADARLSLEFIGRQARRQQNLLRDAELYLAAGQPRGEVEKTDAGKVVAKVLKTMSSGITESGATVTVGDLPPAWIDAPRLTDLFEVTLDNALQHGVVESRRWRDGDASAVETGAALKITIDGEREGSLVRYRVSDNGPGIEEQYRERVFRVFERLSSAGDVDSTGIGLAIVRRIAESCGGRAFVEAAQGGGCVVVFELSAGVVP